MTQDFATDFWHRKRISKPGCNAVSMRAVSACAHVCAHPSAGGTKKPRRLIPTEHADQNYNASTSTESVGEDRACQAAHRAVPDAPPGARWAAHREHGGEGRREGQRRTETAGTAQRPSPLLQSRRDASGGLVSKHTTSTAVGEAGNIYLKP